MSDKVKIAIDAMSGENSPKKIIEGIEISLKSNQENFFYLYGKKDLLEKEIYQKKIFKNIAKLLMRKMLFQMMRVPWLVQKKVKTLVCGKRLKL